jgi:colanic acid biosynthesis glycosyl transferase WcaI
LSFPVAHPQLYPTGIMQILIYSYNYYPEPIGIAPLMTELAEGLVQKGHVVRVITGMPNYPERKIYPGYEGKWYVTEQINGVTVQRCFLRVRSQPNLVDRLLLELSFVVSSLPQALNGWRPDVILVTVPPLFVTLLVFFLGWFYGCPVVLNVQDILHEAAGKIGLIKSKLMVNLLKLIEKFAYQTANHISVITDEFVNILLEKNVSQEKITCIPNWVNVDFVHPLPKEKNSFRMLHKLENKFVVMYSGNIALTQGLETAIASAVKLAKFPDIILVIVGETKALEQLRKYCQTNYRENYSGQYQVSNVLLLPLQPRKALPEMLAAADISLVLQKRHVLGFNMPSKIPLLLASGRPIIASVPDCGTAAKAILKSGGGIVVEPESPGDLADAVLKLYQNPTEMQILAEKGRRFAVESYSSENAIAQYESLLSQAILNRVAKNPSLIQKYNQK